MGIQIKLQKILTQDIIGSKVVELRFEFWSFDFKNMFIPIHGTFAINDMFHINMNYSNILNYVIHKMDMYLYSLFWKYWASAQNGSKLNCYK